jgi:hypothetical protein
MKTPFVIVALALSCGFLFFAAPHHRRQEAAFGQYTLYEMYSGYARSAADAPKSRAPVILALGIAGIASGFYPVFLALALRAFGAAPGGGLRWALVLSGGACVVGALVNFVGMIASDMRFGFGASSSTGNETAYFWVIAAFQIAFAFAGIAAGASPACARFLHRICCF